MSELQAKNTREKANPRDFNSESHPLRNHRGFRGMNLLIIIEEVPRVFYMSALDLMFPGDGAVSSNFSLA